MAALTRDKIFEGVSRVLQDTLGVDEEEVKLGSTLTGDLGAESIDFLDIVFRLEKNFGVKIPRGDLFPEVELSDPRFVRGGWITEAGREALLRRCPWMETVLTDKECWPINVNDLIVVSGIVIYVESKLSGQHSQPGQDPWAKGANRTGR